MCNDLCHELCKVSLKDLYTAIGETHSVGTALAGNWYVKISLIRSSQRLFLDPLLILSVTLHITYLNFRHNENLC